MADDDAGLERAGRRAGHRALVVTSIGLIVAIALLSGFAYVTMKGQEDAERQAALQPFYTPPDPLPAGQPGDVLRVEEAPTPPGGGRAWRILYLSVGPQGDPVAVSGLVMVGTQAPPEGGRPIVAWAHGTTGMAPSCAPSRTADVYSEMPWLAPMLAEGWAVVATDYYGLGTPGVLPYLLGESAGHDVLYSVRAARSMAEVDAGDRFATWGHSQGGHASLWAGQLAATALPELELTAVTAAAPAAELVQLVEEQWDQVASQALGPYVAAAWPTYNPELSVSDVLTPSAERALPSLSQECIVEAAVIGLLRQKAGAGFFSQDPGDVPAWRAVAQANTPSPPGDVPVLVAQGTADQVVLPDTTRTLAAAYCAAGSPLTMDWYQGVDHFGVAKDAAPAVIDFIEARFAGSAEGGNCPSA